MKNNYKVKSFNNPLEAIEYFRLNHNSVDLILTDYSVPYIEGKELVKNLKKINNKVPLVLFTGHSYIIFENEEDRKLVDACIYKPTPPSEIAKHIKMILENAHEKI